VGIVPRNHTSVTLFQGDRAVLKPAQWATETSVMSAKLMDTGREGEGFST